MYSLERSPRKSERWKLQHSDPTVFQLGSSLYIFLMARVPSGVNLDTQIPEFLIPARRGPRTYFDKP